MAIKLLKYQIPFNKILWMVLLAIMLSTIFFLSDCTSVSNEQTYLNHHDSVSYVGIKTCATCHPEKTESFAHTGMGQSFSDATFRNSSADFSKQHIVYDSSTGFYYRPYRKGEELWVQEYLLNKEDTIHAIHVRIDYIVGSGQHTNSHLYNRFGYVYQAPITFYTQEKKWDLAPGFENGNNSRFSRIVDVECMSCHNSMPTMENNSQSQFKTIGHGIDCERCHGPGQLHFERRTAGIEYEEGEIDRTIVNPADLSFQLQMDLCQRCHLQGLNILKEGKKFTDFKPGMLLSDVFDVYLPKYESSTSSVFDMANHSAQLQKSECFIQSNRNEVHLTCITCHDPHQSVTQTNSTYFNAKCISCHAISDLSYVEDEHIATSNCVDCHMPLSKSSDILHVRVHDHQIKKPLSQEDEQSVMKLVGLYSVNNNQPSEEEMTMAYMLYWEKFDKNPYFLDQAFLRITPSSPPEFHLKLNFLKAKYEKVVQTADGLEELDYWQAYMIGESYLKLNENAKAVEYLQLSLRLNRDHPEIAERLLYGLLKLEQFLRVQTLAQQMSDDFPMSGYFQNALAIASLRLGDLNRAEEALKRALHLQPLNLGVWETHLNMALVTKDKAQTAYWADRILTKYPNHPDKDLIRRQRSSFR
ncbi:MAG: hypothetical protein JXR19_00535 [Bacteroidia bacterium]